MSAPPAVRPAHDGEETSIAAVLSDAFVDEDGLNYWLKQGEEKERSRARFFAAAVEDAVHPERTLWLAEGQTAPLGAAIWLSPGQKAYDLTFWKQIALTPLMLSIAGMSGMARGFALAEKLEHHHPREPHAHLVFLGVAPAAQGQGVGSAILKSTLAPLDAGGVTAFLEATTERNVALYQRHGFEITGEIVVPSLHVRCMTRKPRG
ncbi:MAG: GNAT family N-acetyltransferase [Hyphomonadaceae bacterium]|nr:GNAT family N-acetyltransferase [Hyphomonadaceae bacterium]